MSLDQSVLKNQCHTPQVVRQRDLVAEVYAGAAEVYAGAGRHLLPNSSPNPTIEVVCFCEFPLLPIFPPVPAHTCIFQKNCSIFRCKLVATSVGLVTNLRDGHSSTTTLNLVKL